MGSGSCEVDYPIDPDCPGAPLSLVIGAIPGSGEAPLTVDFESFVSGGIWPYTYQWDFFDGTFTCEPPPAPQSDVWSNPQDILFSTPGEKFICLTVTDACGNGISECLTITVGECVTPAGWYCYIGNCKYFYPCGPESSDPVYGPFTLPEQCVCSDDCPSAGWYCVGGTCTEYLTCGPSSGYSSGPHVSQAACLAAGCGDDCPPSGWYCYNGICTFFPDCGPLSGSRGGPYPSQSACQSAGCGVLTFAPMSVAARPVSVKRVGVI